MWRCLKGWIWCIICTPAGETRAPIAVSLDPEEMLLMSAKKLSSVFCEIKNVRLAVETVVSQLGHDSVAGKVIVYR